MGIRKLRALNAAARSEKRAQAWFGGNADHVLQAQVKVGRDEAYKIAEQALLLQAVDLERERRAKV